MSGLFGIGTSALLANQRALSVTGHNIANANSDGYSRQRVDFSARQVNGQMLGQGVNSSSVQRYSDSFATGRLNQSTAQHAAMSDGAELARRLDLVLSDPDTGMAGPLRDFTDAVDAWAADPTATESRVNLLGQADTLAQRFGQIQGGLDSFNNEINARISDHVDEINQLGQSIAQLNDEIALNGGVGGSSTPNDLLDQRDQLARQLSQHVDTQSVIQADGSMNVSIGNGQMLVAGKQVQTLQVVPPANTDNLSGVSIGGTDISRQLQAGGLGGVLAFGRDVLSPAAEQLRDLAGGIANQVNSVQNSGADLNGAPGGDLFSLSPTSARLQLQINDPAELAAAAAGSPAGSGDNSNALLMADALRGPVVGNASASEANISMVGTVGTAARRLEAAETAQAAVLQQHQNLRDEVSAVNLDEEAANMLKYQQAYQAAAQIISTANQMFESLLAAAR